MCKFYMYIANKPNVRLTSEKNTYFKKTSELCSTTLIFFLSQYLLNILMYA